jgi:hypothetical protein
LKSVSEIALKRELHAVVVRDSALQLFMSRKRGSLQHCHVKEQWFVVHETIQNGFCLGGRQIERDMVSIGQPTFGFSSRVARSDV